MARYDAVLFDLDGTLLDSIELILESYRHTLAAHGLAPRSEADVLSGLGQTLEAQFLRWVGQDGPVDALVQTYIEHNLEVHDRFVKPYPGVSELVASLKERGDPLAVVTSKRRRGALLGLRALGLADAFGVLVAGDDVARPKPDPEPVQLALAQLGGPDPARTVFVGDATHDVHSGRAAGVATIAVTWGAGVEAELRAASPDQVVSDAAALAALLLA